MALESEKDSRLYEGKIFDQILVKSWFVRLRPSMPGVIKLLPPCLVILKDAFGLSRVKAVWPLVANMR